MPYRACGIVNLVGGDDDFPVGLVNKKVFTLTENFWQKYKKFSLQVIATDIFCVLSVILSVHFKIFSVLNNLAKLWTQTKKAPF